MRRQLIAGVRMLAVFTVLTGVIYPLVVTGVSQAFFKRKAEGSLVAADGRVVGSALIGQRFTKSKYFHPRPSVAGSGYDASSSAGSNEGPTNPQFLADVKARIASYRAENGLGPRDRVPVDAVTASASGLDPEISVANAEIQARRVARVRGLTVARVLELVSKNTDPRGLGFLGEAGVNVLELNVALDRMTATSSGAAGHSGAQRPDEIP